MKKILFSAIAALFLFSACTIECPEEHLISTSYLVDVPANSWRLNDNSDGVYFWSAWNMPALTQEVLDRGVVLAYFWDGAHDNMLPYIRPYMEQDGYQYFENIRFDYERGKITFIIEPNDFVEPYPITRAMNFKVVVLQNIYH